MKKLKRATFLLIMLLLVQLALPISAVDEAGDPGKNHKGLITFDRRQKKDAYYKPISTRR